MEEKEKRRMTSRRNREFLSDLAAALEYARVFALNDGRDHVEINNVLVEDIVERLCTIVGVDDYEVVEEEGER